MLQGLVRVAEAPQKLCQDQPCSYAWSDGVAEMGRRVELALETRPPLLQMVERCGEFSQMVERAAERLMRRQEQHRIGLLLSQAQKLIGQIAGRLAGALTK